LIQSLTIFHQAGADMIAGLYSAQADSILILCITGPAPRARIYNEVLEVLQK
jgi:glyoxylate carboligase